MQLPCFSSAIVPQAPSIGDGFSFPCWDCSDGSSDSNNVNNGNFICVFESTIVNLATYRQFTNAAEIELLKKKKEEEEEMKIKFASSLGYPNSYFYNKRRNMLL